MQLAHKRYGSGRPVVLVHGYLSDGDYWKPLIPKLAEHYEVITIDLLGFGKSPKPPKASYSLDEHAAAVTETIRIITKEPVVLVGHSMGSLVSARIAAEYPDLLRQLILCNMPLFPDAVQAREVIKRTGPTYHLMLYSPFAPILWPMVRAVWPLIRRLFPARRVIPGPPGAFSAHHTYTSRMRSLFNTVESADALALLHKVRVPTTLINGIFDRRIYKHTIDASSLPANISIEWVDTGHHTIYQIPQAVLDLLIPPSRKS